MVKHGTSECQKIGPTIHFSRNKIRRLNQRLRCRLIGTQRSLKHLQLLRLISGLTQPRWGGNNKKSKQSHQRCLKNSQLPYSWFLQSRHPAFALRLGKCQKIGEQLFIQSRNEPILGQISHKTNAGFVIVESSRIKHNNAGKGIDLAERFSGKCIERCVCRYSWKMSVLSSRSITCGHCVVSHQNEASNRLDLRMGFKRRDENGQTNRFVTFGPEKKIVNINSACLGHVEHFFLLRLLQHPGIGLLHWNSKRLSSLVELPQRDRDAHERVIGIRDEAKLSPIHHLWWLEAS